MEFSLAFVLALLPFTFAGTDPSFWLRLLICFIPAEFSKRFFIFPALSPMDYFSVAALLALIVMSPWKTLWSESKRVFGAAGLFWIAFFFYCAIAACWTGGNPKSAFRWVGFLFCYYLAARASQEDSHFAQSLCAQLAWMAAIVSIHGLVEFYRIRSYVRLESLFNQHNIFSAFLSLCLPASVAYAQEKNTLIPLKMKQALILLISVAFILSYSRGAWMGLALGSIFVYFKRQSLSRPHPFFILIGVLLAALVVHQPSGRGFFSFSSRNDYIRVGMRVLKAHPWAGLGPGAYGQRIRGFLSGEELTLYQTNAEGHLIGFWQHLHNLYLQVLVDYGLVGFAFWAGGLGILVWRALFTNKYSSSRMLTINDLILVSIIAFLIHNLVDIVTVNSFDMLFGTFLATVTFSKPVPVKGTDT